MSKSRDSDAFDGITESDVEAAFIYYLLMKNEIRNKHPVPNKRPPLRYHE